MGGLRRLSSSAQLISTGEPKDIFIPVSCQCSQDELLAIAQTGNICLWHSYRFIPTAVPKKVGVTAEHLSSGEVLPEDAIQSTRARRAFTSALSRSSFARPVAAAAA